MDNAAAKTAQQAAQLIGENAALRDELAEWKARAEGLREAAQELCRASEGELWDALDALSAALSTYEKGEA